MTAPRASVLAALRAERLAEERRLVERRIRRTLHFMEYPTACGMSPELLHELLATLEAERARLTRELGGGT
jgi:hypothetical protein